MTDQRSSPEISQVDEARWSQARERFEVVRRLAQLESRNNADITAAARELNCKKSLVYMLLFRYFQDPTVSGLLPNARGRRRGVSQCSPEVDKLVHEVIEATYLTRQRVTVADVEREVRRRCYELAIRAPSRKAISTRIRAVPRWEVIARRQGPRVARSRLAPVTGRLESPSPLSLVQIDHTQVDVIVVDSANRVPIQRPWLTLAIDVHTRCIAGLHLSLEPPSATSVALCITHAALPKAPWLSERRIDGEWPVQGIFSRLHLDNAKEFRCEALRRGCEQYGIAIDYRPVRTPHYGGHIERLIGTMMGKVHLLPGTTYSNIAARGDIDPEKTAAMTLEEVDRWLGNAIVGIYHGSPHRGIDQTPLSAWQAKVASADYRPPQQVIDPRRFLIDFLPIERRLIRRDGIALHSIHYWSDVLGHWVGDPKPMMVRYDPRDLSRIFVLGPDNEYYDVPYRDLRRPPITLWEQRLALKKLREQAHAHVDEASLFRTVDVMRQIVDGAKDATKQARRLAERRLRLIPGGRSEDNPSTPFESAERAVSSSGSLPPPYEDMLPVEEW